MWCCKVRRASLALALNYQEVNPCRMYCINKSSSRTVTLLPVFMICLGPLWHFLVITHPPSIVFLWSPVLLWLVVLCVIMVCMICLRWMVFWNLVWECDVSLNVLVTLLSMFRKGQCNYLITVIPLVHCRHVIRRSRHLANITVHISVRSIGARGMNDRLTTSLALGEGW